MSTTAQRRGQAQVYAEDKLGVNDVFAQALSLEAALAPALSSRANLEAALREVREKIEQTTFDARAEFREANPKLSATAYDSQVRDYLAGLDRLQELRKEERMHQDNLADATRDVSLLERQHRSRVARMQMLAGYFNFLAATKTSANVARLVADVV